METMQTREAIEGRRMEKKINVEPSSFSLTGFKVEDLLSKEFIRELKKEMPTVVIGCLCFGFSDSKTMIQVGHERVEGKIELEHVYVQGEGPNSDKIAKSTVEVLKKVLSK